MAGALLFLTLRSARNALASRIKRLRQPRYAVGFSAGLLYVYAFFIRRGPNRTGRPAFSGFAAFAGEYPDLVVVIVATLLMAIAALAWLLPRSSRATLKFLPAEVQFLFTAPIARRRLVRYKVLRSCVRPLLSAAFLTVVFHPVTLMTAILGFTGIALIVETLSLYLVGVALRRQPGMGATLWLPRVVAACAFAAVAMTVGLNWTSLASARSEGGFATELVRLGTTGIAGAVLSPFRALARLPLAATPMESLALAPVTLLICALAYRWAVSGDISTEDAAISQPAERATVGPAVATDAKRKKTPFELAAEGRPEAAFLWKNSIAASRVFSAKILLRAVPMVLALLVVVSVAARNTGGTRALGAVAMFCVMAAGYAVAFGPQLAQHDLRGDLRHLQTLKAWPLRGAVIVRGEVLAPAVLLSCFAWMFIAGALALSSNLQFAITVSWPDRVSLALAVALLAPGLILVQVVLHNAIALLFPAWVQAPNARGVDVAGQRLVTMAALLLGIAVACVPAALAAGLVGFAIRQALGVLPVVVPAAVVLVVLFIECAVATEALGGLFERTDIGALQP